MFVGFGSELGDDGFDGGVELGELKIVDFGSVLERSDVADAEC